MQRDWTELIKEFERDCANNSSPAGLVEKLHGDGDLFEDLWMYLTTRNDTVGTEPGGMNREIALRMLLKLSVLEDDLCCALFMSKEGSHEALQAASHELYGDDLGNERVALAKAAEQSAKEYWDTFVGTDEEHERFVRDRVKEFKLFFQGVRKGDSAFSADHRSRLDQLFAVMSRAMRQSLRGDQDLVSQSITDVLAVIDGVLKSHGSDSVVREELVEEQNKWCDLLVAGIPQEESYPAARPSVVVPSQSPDAVPPWDVPVPMDVSPSEDVRGMSSQPPAPPRNSPESAEHAGSPWRRSRAPSPQLAPPVLHMAVEKDPHADAGIARSSSGPVPAAMKTGEEQPSSGERQEFEDRSQIVFWPMALAISKGNLKDVGGFLNGEALKLKRSMENPLLVETDEVNEKAVKSFCWYAACLMSWRKSDTAAPVGPHGQELGRLGQVAQELGVAPDLLQSSHSLDTVTKDKLRMCAYHSMAVLTAMEQGCNIAAVTHDIVRCLLASARQPLGDIGKPDFSESPSFMTASLAFVSHLVRLVRKDDSTELAEFCHAMSVEDPREESRGPLQELFCVTMDSTGKAREVMAEAYTMILHLSERHPPTADSPLKEVFNGTDERVEAHLDQGFISASGPWLLQLGLHLRRVLGDKVNVCVQISLESLQATASGSRAVQDELEVDFLLTAMLWDLQGPLLWTSRQLLLKKLPVQQEGETLASGQVELSVVQAVEEFFKQLDVGKCVTSSVRQKLLRVWEEPVVLEALLLRWVAAVENVMGQSSPALLAGVVSSLSRADLTDVADVATWAAGVSKLHRVQVKQVVKHIVKYREKSANDDLAEEEVAGWASAVLKNWPLSIKALSMLLAAYAMHCKFVEPRIGVMKLVLGLARATLTAALLVGDDPGKSGAIGAVLESVRAFILDSKSPIPPRQALSLLWKCGNTASDLSFYAELGRCERHARQANDARLIFLVRAILSRLLEISPDAMDP